MEINLDITTAFKKHYECKKKIVISQGGGRSGKTISITQILILEALQTPNSIISIVAENMPFLKRGAIRDFIQIMQTSGLWDDNRWNKTESIYRFPTGSIIEFFSVENPGRALGSARDFLFINECNNVPYETAFQLIARTRKRTYLDYNPTGEFWVQEEIMQNPDFDGEYELIISTYKDNEFLEESIIKTMIARGNKDPNYKRVYIDDEMGVAEGLVIPTIKLIDYIPEEIYDKAKMQYLSLDFGYSNDPSSINEVFILGDHKQPVIDIYVDEVAYQTELSNKNLTSIIKDRILKDNYKVIADSSEPKSIAEIESYGVNIYAIEKPQGSVNYGISLLQLANIYVTKNSINTIKEFRNYKWAKDRQGRPVKDSKGRPQPIDLWNHSIDGIRYVAMYHNDQKYQYRDVPRPGIGRRGLIPV